MERRFTTDEFEQFLQQEADNFKMIPSKKVWHGIYNDIHPGRRWPSITISLLLISTLIFIGHMNTPKGPSVHNFTNNISGNNNFVATTTGTASDHLSQKDLNSDGMNQVLLGDQRSDRIFKTPGSSHVANDPSTTHNLNKFVAQLHLSTRNVSKTNDNVMAEVQGNASTLQSNVSARVLVNAQMALTLVPAEMLSANPKKSELITGKIVADNAVSILPEEKITVLNDNLPLQNPVIKDENNNDEYSTDKGEAEKKVLPNVSTQTSIKANSKIKRNDKITYTYFVAPEVTNVSFRGAPISSSVFLSTSVSIMPSNYKVLNHAAFGFEAGAQMNYTFASKWKFTTGVHLTYSGYNIRSNEMHPTVATLILEDPDSHVDYSKQYVSHYGDGSGLTQVNIRNHSLQASLPVGFQYRFFTGDKVQLNASADLEPSIILDSYAYLLSSDGRNYVNDPSLMRKSNMASNFGVFLSFGAKKFTWQIGPIVRYQWFSTYKKDYTIDEHLLNYGIRIGITPFRK